MSVEMRKYLNILRKGGSNINEMKEEIKSDTSMRGMMNKLRKLNEDVNVSKATKLDQRQEEEKMKNFFREENVSIIFDDLEIYEDGSVFWAGSMNGQLTWIFRVTPYEDTDLEIDYEDDFDATNEDNEKIIKKLEAYYESFAEYWRENKSTQNNQ